MDIDLLPCPFCNHMPYEPEQVKSDTWGRYDWIIRCSSSHCRANVRIVADGWKQEIDPELNPHIPPDQLYRDRLTDLRGMWNRRYDPNEPKPIGPMMSRAEQELLHYINTVAIISHEITDTETGEAIVAEGESRWIKEQDFKRYKEGLREAALSQTAILPQSEE